MSPGPRSEPIPAEKNARSGPAERAGRAPHVLVIDDELDFRLTLQLVLREQRLEVSTAEDGLAAVRAAREHRFDLFITDLRMPGMSGTETVTALKALHPDVPLIVVTGYGTEEISAECFARGACQLVRKPFDLQSFLALVNRTLGR
jgi:DNA-binding NtrC family response regulator